MKPTIADVAQQLEQRGELIRTRADPSARIIEHVRGQVGQDLPPDLEAFYRERIARVGDFLAIAPVWNDRVLLAQMDNANGVFIRYMFEAYMLAPHARMLIYYGGTSRLVGGVKPVAEATAIEFFTAAEVPPPPAK